MAKDNLDRMMQSKQARAQNLKKWRESRLHEETLPSGLAVLIRDVDLASIVIEGSIPNTLIDVITKDDFQKLSEEEAGLKLMAEHKTEFNTLLYELIKASLVEPAIGDKADDQHILYSEISFEDKMFIFNLLNREAQSLRPFRDESQKPGEVVQPGGSLWVEAE